MWGWRFYTHRFTAAGRALLLTAFVFLMFGFTSLDLQAFIPVTDMLGVGLVVIGTTVLTRPRAQVRAELSDRVGAGETLAVTLRVTNRARQAGRGWTALPTRLPPSIDPLEPDGVALPTLAAGETARVTLSLLCRARGRFTLRGWRISTSYPFGLLQAYLFAREERTLLVYPRFTPLSRLLIPVGRRYQPGGVALASSLGDSYEFFGNREYREGDSVRNIDWRATARLDHPIVREYREEYFHRVAVILDTQAGRAPSADFEHAISLCAAISDWLARREYIVDLFAAGPQLYHLTAGRSLAYVDQILDILACLEPTPQDPFAVLEPEILENLTQITTVLCVFLDWDETRRALAMRLQSEGAGVKVWVVRDLPCSRDPSADQGLLGELILLTASDFAAGVTEL